MRRLKHGLHTCTFTPSTGGIHFVDVFVDGIRLTGANSDRSAVGACAKYKRHLECPYECVIRDSGQLRIRGDQLTLAQCGKIARLEVVGDARGNELDVTIQGERRAAAS